MVWGISLKNKSTNGFSIKKRLTWSVVLLSSCLILVSLIFSYLGSQHEIREVYDARLGQEAKMALLSLPPVIAHLDTPESKRQLARWMGKLDRSSKANGGEDPTKYGHPYEHKIVIQYYRDGQLLWSSLPHIGALSQQTDYQGFGVLHSQGKSWRFFQLSLANSHDYVITAEQQAIRDEMMNDLAFSAALPQLILIPCLAILMIILINKLLSPLTDLRASIRERSVDKLDQIEMPQATQELTPLVEALNRLLVELESAWEREKRFTRMAAHELKTPLTILRLNAENALASQDKTLLNGALNNILAGIDRTDRLIQQLLMLARVDSVQDIGFEAIDVYSLLQSVLADIAPMALKKQQDLSLDGASQILQGDAALLRILFTNLIDNAIRYSGEKSTITAEVERTATHLVITVSDSGPDMSADTRHKLFDNFYRANTERGDGAGLGMSITRDIARLHHGTVTLLPRTQQKNTFVVEFTLHS